MGLSVSDVPNRIAASLVPDSLTYRTARGAAEVIYLTRSMHLVSHLLLLRKHCCILL